MRAHDGENQQPSHRSCDVGKLSAAWGSAGGDQDVLVAIQKKKLSEMRVSQMNYFDTRMIELQERRLELDKREANISTREEQIGEITKRLEIEKLELNQIRQLLRVENEALRISSKDLRDQIRKYEVVIKMMMRNHPGKVRGDNSSPSG